MSNRFLSYWSCETGHEKFYSDDVALQKSLPLITHGPQPIIDIIRVS